MPPLLSIAPAARRASCLFSEPSRSEAEKTRNETGSRTCASIVVISSEIDVFGAYSAAMGESVRFRAGRPLFLSLLASPAASGPGFHPNRRSSRGSLALSRSRRLVATSHGVAGGASRSAPPANALLRVRRCGWLHAVCAALAGDDHGTGSVLNDLSTDATQ